MPLHPGQLSTVIREQYPYSLRSSVFPQEGQVLSVSDRWRAIS
jgi:hypothetical protein